MLGISNWTKGFLGLVAFSLLGSLLTAKTGLDPGPIKPVASLLTIACGFMALAQLAKWWQIVLVLIVGAAAEVCGLYTGYPFGQYEYTNRWWPIISLPQNQNFPFLLPLAWFLIAGGSALALRPLGKPMLVLAPILATLLDFFMEPVMVNKLGYWRWVGDGPLPGGAPQMNLAGWFGTSLVAALILCRSGKESKSSDPVWVLVGFFILIAGIWAIPGSTSQ